MNANEHGPSRLEKEIAEYFQAKGIVCLHNGWPDFLVVHPETRKVYCIEAKIPPDKATENQLNIHRYLKLVGLDTHIVNDLQTVKSIRGRKLASVGQYMYEQRNADRMED